MALSLCGPAPGLDKHDRVIARSVESAANANRMFLLCRTDVRAEKHAGLSYVLIDFTDPGVTYRPIKQMSGAQEFAEDFIDAVRAPLFNVIGGLNNGWRVAMTTLGHERGGRATVAHLGYEREFWELVTENPVWGPFPNQAGATSQPLRDLTDQMIAMAAMSMSVASARPAAEPPCAARGAPGHGRVGRRRGDQRRHR